MLFYLVALIFLLLMYVAWKAAFLVKSQAAIVAFLQDELKDIKAAQELPRPASLAYGWFDGGWPVAKVDEEDRASLENPTPHRSPDDYATHNYILEYKSILSAHQRKGFLLQLSREGVWMKPALLDVIYSDESAYVRSWAAAHLATDFTDYTGWTFRDWPSSTGGPPKIRDYEPDLLGDSEPTVRAALWSNPQCRGLPWDIISIPKDWKERFHGMSQLERLGLMRNPNLSMRYVVALLETDSKDLNVTETEHADILVAAATNPGLIGSSRRTGREFWIVEGDPNPPFKEFGQMWELCLDRWTGVPRVPHSFMRYIQTVPEVKLAAYTRLLENSNLKWLRQEVIRSCDPFIDKAVLKLAYDDPDEECRKIAKERIGHLAEYVGVKEKKSS